MVCINQNIFKLSGNYFDYCGIVFLAMGDDAGLRATVNVDKDD